MKFTKMMETGEFIAGGRFVLQLAPMQNLYNVKGITDYFKMLFDRRVGLSERARASVITILSYPEQ